VIVYEGLTPDDVLNRMATDNLAQQLSSSWGSPSIEETTDQIFQQFAAQGQTMFEASGDSGAYVGPIGPPSDDPYVTVVGGTTLTTAGPGGAWLSETVWNWLSSSMGSGGSGGGVSTVYPLPRWQQGLSFSKCQGSGTMRNIPDVALTADNVLVVAEGGQQFYVGGTSCAAPLWAGLTALVNQQQAANSQPPLGFLNPVLYAIGKGAHYAAAFHDITTGNNTNYNSPAAFFAVPGYDLCTGWGTPNGSNFLGALVTTADDLRITPTGSLVAQGPVGGPFSTG
jgi:subtilase family serine protease